MRRFPVILALALAGAGGSGPLGRFATSTYEARSAPGLPTPHGGLSPWIVTLPDGRPVRWPCGSPITWAVSTAATVPPGGIATIREGLERITAASGLRFAYVGETGARPVPSWRPRPGGSEVLVGWLPRRSDALFGPPFPRAVAMTGDLYEGGMLVGAAVDFAPGFWSRARSGFGAGVTQGEESIHELEHVVGIADQLARPADLSFEELIPRRSVAFGPADRAELSELGCPAP